jgi:hypothetical protein
LKCEACNFTIHKKCQASVTNNCHPKRHTPSLAKSAQDTTLSPGRERRNTDAAASLSPRVLSKAEEVQKRRMTVAYDAKQLQQDMEKLKKSEIQKK